MGSPRGVFPPLSPIPTLQCELLGMGAVSASPCPPQLGGRGARCTFSGCSTRLTGTGWPSDRRAEAESPARCAQAAGGHGEDTGSREQLLVPRCN